MSVALTRLRVTYGLKPGVKGIFSFFVPFLFHIFCPNYLVLQFIHPFYVV